MTLSSRTLSSRGSWSLDSLTDLCGNDNSDLNVHFITYTTCALAAIYLDQSTFICLKKKKKLVAEILVPK